MEDDAIRALVSRLARPHRSGGKVIERADVLASGQDSEAVLTWITANGGEPEEHVPAATNRGLHSARLSEHAGRGARAPLRYVFPRDAL
jgi:hypothetical protein